MTIDEAIAKYKEITNIDAICPAHCNISCDKCVQESKQIIEWLEELKELRKNKEDYSKGIQTSYATFMYNKAINDCLEILYFHQNEYDGIQWAIREIEEIKMEGGE